MRETNQRKDIIQSSPIFRSHLVQKSPFNRVTVRQSNLKQQHSRQHEPNQRNRVIFSYPAAGPNQNNFYSRINLNNSQNQKQKYHENPNVTLKNIKPNLEISYASAGWTYPNIQNIQLVKQTKKTIKKQQIPKTKNTNNECSYVSWIIAGILLLAFIAVTVLFVLCKVNQNKTNNVYLQTNKTNNQNVSKQTSNQIFPVLVSKKEILNQKDCVYPIVPIQMEQSSNQTNQNQNKNIPNQNRVTQYIASLFKKIRKNPQNSFNQIDHTNYNFLHLRKNSSL